MKDFPTQTTDSKSVTTPKKSRSFNPRQRSPTKTRSFTSTWKEAGRTEQPTLDIESEKQLKQQQFQQHQLSNPIEVLLEEEILITPELLLQSTSAPSSSLPSSTATLLESEIEELPTKDVAPTPSNVNILELLAKKDNLKKIAHSVEQIQTTTSIPLPISSYTSSSNSPKKQLKSKQATSNNTTNTTNNNPPRAPSPPTKQPKRNTNTNISPNASTSNSRNPSPSKASSNNSNSSSSGITSNNSNTATNNTELRFAGPAFHNSPSPNQLPIPPSDFFSGKNRDTTNNSTNNTTSVKMPSDTSHVILISNSPPTRDTNTTSNTSPAPSTAVDSVRMNFANLPEFQQPTTPAVFPFPSTSPMGVPHPNMMMGSWPSHPMAMNPHPMPIIAPIAPPVMLDQMSSQLKMMLNIAS